MANLATLILDEILTKRNGKYALVSRSNPRKVLKYWNHKPSKDEVSRREMEIHYFKNK